MRYQLNAPILSHERLGEYEYEMTLHAPEVAAEARPGQFMQVLYDPQNLNPFTRRPFSVYRVDRSKGTFSIVYLARGSFTNGLRGKRPGENLSIVGPLGNWYTPDSRPKALHFLVAGGVGAPPIYLLAERMVEAGHRNLTVINGARTRDLLVAVKELEALNVDLRITTDDGSLGEMGLVTDALLPLLPGRSEPAHVYTCGPTAMLRAVGNLCAAHNVPCQVSVETVMPCGVGVCMGCVVKVKDSATETGYQNLRSCYEGPVFKEGDIIWDS